MTSNNDDFDDEASEYAAVDLVDTMIQGEIGEMVEGEEARNGRVDADEAGYENTINALRRNAVGESSQNTYLCEISNFLNWVYRSAGNQVYGETEPCSDSWAAELSVFAVEDDARRKRFIKQKAMNPDEGDPPLDFDSFVAGK